ncbi:MAG: TRAP transporter small permease subunit, partial [Defluviitaleaceae bacterium]|nr:TRAP transporter small permease subunit [Defluviitaleaceae bacterium]
MEEKPKKLTITDGLTKVLNVTIAIVLFSMVGMIFLNAVLRYAFNTSWPASEELSRYLFVWVTMLGAVIAYKDNGHVGVD